jgi:hypothetical protein
MGSLIDMFSTCEQVLDKEAKIMAKGKDKKPIN